jgi:glycosyltransferase involved in cell wall biosynthesis
MEAILGKFNVTQNVNYLLHVGSNLPRKNRFFVIQVLSRLRELIPELNLRLYFVGPGLDSIEKEYIKKNDLSDFVTVVSNVTHDMLRAFYSGAFAFLFPSLFEGFGWPVIEAQSCECAVFTSNRPPMTEVGGDGAKYFDPGNVDEAARLIVNTIPDLQKLKNAGKNNVERFSTATMLHGYLEAYMQAIRDKKL